MVGGWHSVELLRRSAWEEFELAKPHRDLLKALGTDVFIVAETSNAIHGRRDLPLSRRPVMEGGDWAGYGAKMTEIAELLAAEGFRLCYHHHVGTIVETGTDIDAFMAKTRPPARLIPPAKVHEERRGKGSNIRHVRNILAEGDPAESLLVVEVITPAGNRSSYPPHKHDRDDFPDESCSKKPTTTASTRPRHTACSGSTPSTDRSPRPELRGPRCRAGAAATVRSAPRTVTRSTTSTSWPARRGAWRFYNDPDHEWVLRA